MSAFKVFSKSEVKTFEDMDDLWSESGEEAHHYAHFHSESCNGRMHTIVCANPSYHDQMYSRHVCTENCPVYERNMLELITPEFYGEDANEMDVFRDIHDTQYHSEICNGHTHVVICTNPAEHDRITSYYICDFDCSVHIRSRMTQKIRETIPVPPEYLDPERTDIDEVDVCITKPQHPCLILDGKTGHGHQNQLAENAPKQAKRSVKNQRKHKKEDNTFANHLRKLRALERRMVNTTTRPPSPEKDGDITRTPKRAPRRLDL